MNKQLIWILLFVFTLSGGAFFRVWRLTDRPMHTDEAVHAEKFKALLQEGFYAYDPDEYHGPILNYLTLASAWMRGETTYTQITETTLRLTPAVFGILMILTPLLFVRILGLRAVFFSSIFLAFSPAFIYYSRYYIQETLLVFFTAGFLGCLCNYLKRPRLHWLVLSGLSVGLMHASKETFVFSIAAAAVALCVGVLSRDIRLNVKIRHLICGVVAMLLASVVFYSSFGSNPEGILDSVKTYFIWAQRAGGDSVHIHPWYFYLDLLTWLEFIEPIAWNEDGIVALALVGLVIVFLKQGGRRYRTARFLAIYTLVLTVIYSAIPYKTPWSMLSFLYGMAAVAGFTADRLLQNAQGPITRFIFWCLIIIYGLAAPIIQSFYLNFQFASEPVNPYVYAHTSDDVYAMTEAIHKAAQTSQAGNEILIQVIDAKDDYWPFPWYLRDYTNVGYWSEVDASVCEVPIIISNAELEQSILDKLYSTPAPGERHLYVPLFDGTHYLRPHVPWRGYIRKSLWDRIQQSPEQTSQPAPAKERLLQSQPRKDGIENLVKFSHRAMNTNFEVFIQDTRGSYAGRAARAAFNEVDRLEGLLSRYIENSDVSRINLLKEGEEVVVDEDTLQCLQVALNAWEQTGGAFDVTLGDVISAWKEGNTQSASTLLKGRAGIEAIKLMPEIFTVRVAEPLILDLGGVGKGYAVDVIAQVLTEWGIEKALIHGGASSVRAFNPPEGKSGWPVTLTNPIDQLTIAQIKMKNQVLSCSGLQRGEHIINPFTGKTVTDRRACWVLRKDNAALADALSTGGMIMSIDQIRQCHNDHQDTSFMVLMTDIGQMPDLIKIGRWEFD